MVWDFAEYPASAMHTVQAVFGILTNIGKVAESRRSVGCFVPRALPVLERWRQSPTVLERAAAFMRNAAASTEHVPLLLALLPRVRV